MEFDEDHDALWGEGRAAVQRHILLCIWVIASGHLTASDLDGAVQSREHQLIIQDPGTNTQLKNATSPAHAWCAC